MEKEIARKSAERLDSRKSHSWWWESHINTKSAKWLSENMGEMDNSIGCMMKLIDDDGESLTKKAEMYYKKKPELVSLVQEFQRMYQSLAERYVQLTADLQKHLPDLHSGTPDSNSEPATPWFSPEIKHSRFRSSHHRAAGFDVFLGSGGSASSRADESYPFSDSEESDISSVHSYPRYPMNGEEALHEKMEAESGSLKRTESVSVIELQLKIASYEEEIASLKMELQSQRTGEFDPDQKTQSLIRELSTTQGRLLDVEKQVVRLSSENKSAHENIRQLQDQLKTVQKDAAVLKSKLDSEMRKASKWQDRIVRYKASLIDRDVEIRELKDIVSDVNRKYQLQNEISRLSDEKARVEESLRELDVKCQSLENQLVAVEKKMSGEMEELKAELSMKNDQMEILMRERDDFLKYMNELKLRAEGLNQEVERQKVVILEEGELKREAIRQLCCSLEHYRDGYEQLKMAVVGRKRQNGSLR